MTGFFKQKYLKLRHWYEKYDRRISIASLMTGFVVDSLTLQRIDALRENLWIAGNILVVGICIIVLNRGRIGKKRFWLPNILQFSFGALLGSFFIFYFRSATLTATWPFLAILLAAMVANELFQKRYERLAFQLSFFYFSLFSFSIFLVPLLVRSIRPEVFLLSGAVSLVVIWLFISLLRRFATERFLENKTHIWSFIAVIFVVVNALYFMNLIPPIPLALKDSGIYHSVSRNNEGNYVVTEEVRGVEKYFELYQKVHWQEGEPLYAYTAVFSPGSINTDIVHHWQYRNTEGEWMTVTRTPLFLSGGRGGGFRTFSHKFNFTPGRWRVSVETPRGQVIGRMNFEIIPVTGAPIRKESVKQ
jgi:hypothetical protein